MLFQNRNRLIDVGDMPGNLNEEFMCRCKAACQNALSPLNKVLFLPTSEACCPTDIHEITLKKYKLKHGHQSCVHWSENAYLKPFRYRLKIQSSVLSDKRIF